MLDQGNNHQNNNHWHQNNWDKQLKYWNKGFSNWEFRLKQGG